MNEVTTARFVVGRRVLSDVGIDNSSMPYAEKFTKGDSTDCGVNLKTAQPTSPRVSATQIGICHPGLSGQVCCY